MSLSVETYALSKKYTDDSISGISGALAGKNCTIQSITEITGGHRVTFQWTADDSTTRTSTMDVMDGVDGEVPAESLLKDTVGWIGKNIADVSKAEIGIAWNGDSNSARARLVVPCDSSTKYIVSVSGTIGVDYIGVVSSASVPSGTAPTNITSLLPYEITTGASDKYITLAFSKTDITQADVDALKIMLRDASITDSTFEPYHKSVEDAISDVYGVMGENGAKNKLPVLFSAVKSANNAGTWNNNVYTQDGVSATCEVDANGYVLSVTLDSNGSPTTGNLYFNLGNTLSETGNFILSGSPENKPNNTHIFVRVRDALNTKWTYYSDTTGKGKPFSIASGEFANCVIQSLSGTICNNLVFYPMIRDARDTDSTYVPYTMTNRELTEKKLDKFAQLLDSNTDLDNVTTDGFYIWKSSMPTHSPENLTWANMLVTSNGENINQFVYRKEFIYQRLKAGIPVTWSSWYKFTGTTVS